MADVRTLKLNLLADVDKFGQGMKDADKYASGLDDNIKTYSKNMAKAFGAVVIAAGVMAVQIGIKAISAASDLEESLSKVQQIFGGSGKEVVKFSKTTSKNLGISQQDALDAASTFATFGKSAGLAGQDLVDFSSDLTTLSADFASFYNTSPEDAILAIGAALRGESEPIRKYGVLLDDNTLKAQAMKDGLYDGTGALDSQSKVLAAHKVILDQSKDAQGDFARTSDGLANQTRITKARIEDLTSQIGESLLPVVLNMVSFFQDKILPVVEQVADGFSGKDPNGLSARALELGASMGDNGGYSLGSSLKAVADAFSNLFGAINTDGDKSANILGDVAGAINKVADAINWMAEAYGKLDRFTNSKGYQAVLDAIFGSKKGGVSTSIFNPFGTNFAGAGALTGARAAGGPVSMGGSYLVGERGPEIFTPNIGGRIASSGGGGGTVINLNGIVDAESARRSIEQLIQRSARRTGAIDWVGATL
jgi:hypothetical protein